MIFNGGVMTDNDVKKAKIISILDAAKPRKTANDKPSQVINGNGNIQAGGDIHINKKETIRKEFKPGPEHITAAQARKLQKLVEKATEIEETAGVDRGKAFAKWWSRLKDLYNVGTYREIPAHLGDAAIAYMTQQIAIMRPKLRRNDNPAWRNEHYKGIYARARQLGISKGEVYAIAFDRLGVQVVSLTKLGDQNLKKLYQIIMAM